MIESYQFIRYDAQTTVEHIKKYFCHTDIICFDLEDSICDKLDPGKTKDMKTRYRNILNELLNAIHGNLGEVKIGIRINSLYSGYFESDVELLAKTKHIHSLILPKVDAHEEWEEIKGALDSKQIRYTELIPLIESKAGLNNLKRILAADKRIRKVGFGHCDYNLSIEAFPFFHQDTGEYWKWVEFIIETIRPFNIKLIHSAYLHLGNTAFFKAMLAHLNFLSPDGFSQFTLSTQQSLLCRSFNGSCIPLDDIAMNRLHLHNSHNDLETFIEEFERDNAGRNFTIRIRDNNLLSPQEYTLARRRFQNWKARTLNFTFVGGCFPVQGDIFFEDLFHQLLKSDLEKKFPLNFNVNIIRYERFINCLDKIKQYGTQNDIDHLVFHVRPEPYLRLVKFYYRYLNYEKKPCRSFNIPFLKMVNPEKYDVLVLSRRYSYQQDRKRTRLNRRLIDANYIIGWLLGNKRYAAAKYLQLVYHLSEYCKTRHIQFTVLGTAIRSETPSEKALTLRLDKFMSDSLKTAGIEYLSGADEHIKEGVKLFNHNGIHATRHYHELIKQRLFRCIEEKLNPKSA